MPLFEVAILEMPKKTKDDEGIERLIFGPQSMIAKSDKAAANQALKILFKSEDLYGEVDPDRLQVLIRPF